jgi:hypothetical protein
MKKIIAILVALAVVSTVFAQTVSMSNTLEARPVIQINGAKAAWAWGADRSDGALLKDTIDVSGETGDGRGKFKAEVYEFFKVVDPAGTGLLNVVPRLGFTSPTANVIATYKPLDFLAFGIATFHGFLSAGAYLNAAYGMPGIADHGEGASYWYENGNKNGNKWDAFGSANQWSGIFVTFLGEGVGVDGLKASVYFDNDLFNKNTFSIGVLGGYWGDIFAVSAKYDGTFGNQSATVDDGAKALATAGGYSISAASPWGLNAGSYDKKADYTHNFAAGVAYHGLKELAVGIDLGAAFNAVFSRSGSDQNQHFGVGIGADFDFRNNIKDNVWARVGFGNTKGTAAKVLPFGFGNNLTYTIGGDFDAVFSFDIAYCQDSLSRKLKEAKTTDPNSMDIYVYPRFQFSIDGKNTFVFGVKNDVIGHLEYTEKDNNDWAHTKVYGEQVRVEIPLKWTHKF